MPRRLTFRFGDRDVTVDLLDAETATVDGSTLRVAAGGAGLVRTDGRTAWVASAGGRRWVYIDGCVYVLDEQRDDGRRDKRRHSGSLAAPMPATVRQIRFKAGDAVTRGDTLIVLEAMKMELPVRANVDGTVSAVHCREGELVQPGRPLIDVTEATEG